MKISRKIFAVLVILLVALSLLPIESSSVQNGKETKASDDYLTAAIKSQIEDLNPLTIKDEWSEYTAKQPIYEGLSDYHEESQEVVPWLAYDWSSIDASGEGTYQTGSNYSDPDLTTVHNENLPSGNLEVVVRLRQGIKFHRSEDWFDEDENWKSPYRDHEIPGDQMEEMTAHDVVFTIEMLLWEAPMYRSNFLYLDGTTNGNSSDISDPHWVVNGGTGMYEGIQILDNYTVKFTLEDHDSLFYINTLSMVLSMKVWAGHTLLNGGSDNALKWDCGESGSIGEQKKAIVGTGPFMWTDWDPGTDIRLDTNPDYWLDGSLDEEKMKSMSLKKVDLRPSFNGIKFIIRSTTDAGVISLKDGEADTILWSLDPGYISDILDHPDTNVKSTPEFGFTYMGFNMREPAFGYKNHPGVGENNSEWYGKDISSKFRNAIVHATEKPYIVNNYLQGYGRVGWSVVTPDNNKYHNSTVKTYAFDLDKAEDLLIEQNDIWQEEFPGFPDWNGTQDGWFPIPRRDSSGDVYADTSEFELLTETKFYSPIINRHGLRVADTLRNELKVNVKSMGQNYFPLKQRIQPETSDFDIYILDFNTNDIECLEYLESLFHSRQDIEGGMNYAGFRNEKFDEIVEKARHTEDSEKRVEYVKQLQGIISKELPFNPLYYKYQINGYRKEWYGWTSWPGGIWNRYSWGHLTDLYGTAKLHVKAPSDIAQTHSYDIQITVRNEEMDPMPNIEVNLTVTDGRLVLDDDNMTDSTGRINATFEAPSVDYPKSVFLDMKIAEGEYDFCPLGLEKRHQFTVYAVDLEVLYLEVDVDLDFISVNKTANISISVDSVESINNITVYLRIYPTLEGINITGINRSGDEYIMFLHSGEEKLIRFKPYNVTEGEITEFVIEAEAQKSLCISDFDEVQIQVEGPPAQEEELDDGTPFVGAPLFIILILTLVILFRRKRWNDEKR